MWKKLVVIVLMLALFAWSLTLIKKQKPEAVQTTAEEETEQVVQIEEQLPETVYSFNAQNVTEECSEDVNDMLCTVERAVKCTLKPDLDICKKLNLPTFIFMTDPTVERPTEMNYKFINKKVLPNGTTEIYTESSCNGGWFDLCQGTIIYVLGQNSGTWYVKDIYAIE